MTIDVRLGHGFDVHQFCDGDCVTLCGVKIPYSKSLLGHSDADVGLHALTDALYGALGAGDIGKHFPPSDSEWKDRDSTFFLKAASDLVAKRLGTIMNVDVTLICEQPKIGPHAPAMKEQIASTLSLCPSRVNVKATTTETLGFTGREEGIAAMATAAILMTTDNR